MRNKSKSLILILLILLTLISSSIFISAQSEVTIKLNNIKISFPNVKPYMDAKAGRVLVPVSFVAERLGAEVKWDQANKAVDIIKDNTNMRFKIGEERFTLNGINKSMDTVAFLKDGRTFVPLRFISESLGIDIGWDPKTYTVSLKERNINKEFVVQGISVGSTEEDLISKLGQPDRKDLSKYGFEWYIYNRDYSKYIQVGIKDKKVVGIYTNVDNWKSTKGIKIGMERAEVERLLGKSLNSVRKGNTVYSIYNVDEKGLYLIDGSYVSIFYDIHENNTVTSLQIIDEDIELGLDGYYGVYSEKLRNSFERQIFDLANVIRIRNGLEPFTWSDEAMISSRKHSQDMADSDYFEHINLKGESPFDRMKKEGITYISAAENIAAGTSDAIETHEGWMNSSEHRNSILGEYKTIGVGGAYNSSSTYKYYYTQNFFTGI
ncbi:CAP-associated domain-containing protein [Alkaliphilus sp. B6464]|uniref:CAP-associated domain-containing protein n=1 Tax=Alkaliphilus sp. B6464 TaxID=2731219 RepID=UPI001BA933EF|nr:CAP-associated domain-containing protein [Alkaliphilus sp. B6464]QUH19726.1 copper amine oxidase [Alkaliphilus sp. B6464]